jgi:hypothetical protein
MSKRPKIEAQRLDELERDFEALLFSCLEKCAKGRWGLLGQNDHLDSEHRYYKWRDADRLKGLALKIQELRRQFGGSNMMCDRFLHCCSLRGANVPGEPKLASILLDELSAMRKSRDESPSV